MLKTSLETEYVSLDVAIFYTPIMVELSLSPHIIFQFSEMHMFITFPCECMQHLCQEQKRTSTETHE